jgi:hypothetical protein
MTTKCSAAQAKNVQTAIFHAGLAALLFDLRAADVDDGAADLSSKRRGGLSVVS